ncbi:hypothetical protein [Candidatus Formimonas warabiya]|uniref:Uncharacterized protein n=1 Tax=Formimonas warabiya TaxID=1761012 RepID=A0A3G1KV98_FORW1|nr:hypothetical protein [Candidatus Formimonas warabiya]ATW26443.1 hypothetical protein DCMF_18315 [Candidatus Formimonas warabiya]
MNRDLFKLDLTGVEEVNRYLTDPNNPLMNDVLRMVAKYGTVQEINACAQKARDLSRILERLQNMKSPYYEDLKWLMAERDKGSFISVSRYRENMLGRDAGKMNFDEARAVTLEISALQYFPWLIREAEQAIAQQEIMPGRYIRVRKMKEQESDQGDTMAMVGAMQIMGATWVETLDTKGTDGSNVHLGGPETITGYFGGIGQPNEHPLQWIDEVLYYYTHYGIDQVLNINPGTVLLGYLLHRLGIDIKFKISVFMGNDNPFSVLWTLMMARLFAREDQSTPLVGFNLANSVNAKTIITSSEIRHKLGFENKVRLEHHITETYKSIVCQPYNRRKELLEVASTVPNISAKHEGGEWEIEATREHPSDILDYFRTKDELQASEEMALLEQNYLDKHHSVNLTAQALTKQGIGFIGAANLHRR